MAKTQEELNELKKEFEVLTAKLKELTEDELKQIAGGTGYGGLAQIDKEKCVGCGACAKQCPCEAITLSAGYAEVITGKCDGCGCCVDCCPAEAVMMVK